MTIARILPLMLAFAFLSSCATQRLHTFFVGDGQFQFFVDPFELKSERSKALIDITYRTSEKDTIPATMNFSLFYKDSIREISEAYLVLESGEHKLDSLEVIYREAKYDKIRYTGKISIAAFKEFFSKDEAVFEVKTLTDGEIVRYSGDIRKTAEKVREEVFQNYGF